MNFRTNIVEAMLLSMQHLREGGIDGAALLARIWELTDLHVEFHFSVDLPGTLSWDESREHDVLLKFATLLRWDHPVQEDATSFMYDAESAAAWLRKYTDSSAYEAHQCSMHENESRIKKH